MMVMVEFLSPLLNLMSGGQGSAKLAVALFILVIGYSAVRVLKTASRRFWIEDQDLNRKQGAKREEVLKNAGYLLNAGVISIALLYLNNQITSAFVDQLSDFAPKVLSAALVGLLGIIAIRLLTELAENFMETVGASNYLREVGLSRSAIKVIAGLFKGFLYLVLLQVALAQMGIGDTFVRELVDASSWAAAFLIAGLLFYGFKDLFHNFAAGIYLKNSRYIRPGEEVRLEGEDTEIRDISLFSTSLDTGSGRTVISPNTKVMESDISVKRTKSDLETLEEVRKYFAAETPDDSGAASLQMGLEILGYRLSSSDIEQEEAKMSSAEMIGKVEEITDGEVKAGFVEEDKVTSLQAEFKTWFNDGALVIPVFDDQTLFNDSSSGQYALSVAVESDEILVADPGAEKGGVYYVGGERLQEAMRKVDHSGYIVMAPEGTRAYWRLKKDLLYSDRELYGELSKTLEARLTKIMRQGRILDEAMPEPVSDYLAEWRKSGDVARLWSVEQE